eukprot:gene38644-50753_t
MAPARNPRCRAPGAWLRKQSETNRRNCSALRPSRGRTRPLLFLRGVGAQATVSVAASALAAAVLAAVISGCSGDGDGPADTVLRGGKVVTMDDQRTVAQAVAVREGRIVFVGTDAEVARHIGKDTRVIELGGRMLMPGFVDGHLHSLAGGRALLVCDLAYAPLTRTQLASRLQACLDATPDATADTWLEAVNWDRQSTASLD